MADKKRNRSEPYKLPDDPFFAGYSASVFSSQKDGRIRIFGIRGRAILKMTNAISLSEIQKWNIRISRPVRKRLTVKVVNHHAAIEAAILAINREVEMAMQSRPVYSEAMHEEMSL